MTLQKPSLKFSVRILVPLASLALLLAAPTAAQADWGAIAVDPLNGKFGISHDRNSAKAAKRQARKKCRSKHCKVAVWVANGYAAVVQKRRNGLYFAGYGRTKKRAFAKARRRTNESNPRRVAWVFSGY